MLRAFRNRPMRLCVKAVLALLVVGLRPAAGLPRCPPQDELLAKAEIVVEARVKSLSIGESGLLVTDGTPTRMTRVDLEIKRVIKGKYSGTEAIVYGTVYPPGPIRELTMMAVLAGLGDDDTFEWELQRREIGDGVAVFSMSSCNYYKFPVDIVGPD
ncbi:hypothetical protein [Rhizobium sp. CCGE 510]|uniref:hypothetical protein n=1 Tax=Rhizobium sp. CCGE 510 TaxID=1132836 RepID=UPI00027B8354|nr:hypothetical protein [Rhizobium sp. CCGE 510]EJT06794.1 hypothetical protein RCCGE510_03333 [Rhizobium sp. CCGE 510]